LRSVGRADERQSHDQQERRLANDLDRSNDAKLAALLIYGTIED